MDARLESDEMQPAGHGYVYPSEGANIMKFELAFSYVFKDPDWIKKILILSAIQLIPFVGQVVAAGWLLEITRRVARGDAPERCLPDLEFGEQFVNGLKALVVGLVYMIPVFLFIVPLLLVIIPVSNGGSEGAEAIIIITSLCFTGIMILYSILLMFLMPAAMGRLAVKGSIGAGLQIGEVFGMVRRAPLAYLIVILATWVSSIIAPLGGIVFGIGSLVTATYANAINGHLYGQAYREAYPAADASPYPSTPTPSPVDWNNPSL